MKVIIFMGSLTMGGAERVAITLASYLANNNVCTYLVSFDKNEPSYKIDKNVNFINYQNSHSNKYDGIKRRIKFMCEEFDKINPDLIFTMFYDINLYALIYKKFHNKKVKIVSSERCNPNQIKGIKRILMSISSKMCDGFIFQTERAKKTYSKKVQMNSVVIHNAISNPKLKEINVNEIKKEKTIVSMGRLEEQKAHDIMIQACKPILDKHSDYKLIIYGEGSKRKYLEDLIKYLELTNKVVLPGNDENAIKKVATAQIFLLTSRYEGMPNALLEAMSLGIPSISTDCDMGPAELIENGKNGFLVPVDDVEAISEKLELLISDENLRKNISLNSTKINDTHSVNIIYDKYLNYFKKIVGGKNV